MVDFLHSLESSTSEERRWLIANLAHSVGKPSEARRRPRGGLGADARRALLLWKDVAEEDRSYIMSCWELEEADAGLELAHHAGLSSAEIATDKQAVAESPPPWFASLALRSIDAVLAAGSFLQNGGGTKEFTVRMLTDVLGKAGRHVSNTASLVNYLKSRNAPLLEVAMSGKERGTTTYRLTALGTAKAQSLYTRFGPI